MYTRFLVVLSLLVGFAIGWRIGQFGPMDCIFGIPWTAYVLFLPLGFIVLTFLVRIAPLLINPPIVLNPPPKYLTTLNLVSGAKGK